MDTFFSQTTCDRCGKNLNGTRTCSWFTTETICMDCSDRESEIKAKLREKGKSDMEGCGFVPNPDNVMASGAVIQEKGI